MAGSRDGFGGWSRASKVGEDELRRGDSAGEAVPGVEKIAICERDWRKVGTDASSVCGDSHTDRGHGGCLRGSEQGLGMGSGTQTRIKRAPATAVSPTERARWHARATSFYEDLRGPARGLIRRAYGSKFGDDEIEDIYSSAWLGTLRALERKHDELSDEEIRSYVLTAVANHASKEIRRRKRKPIAPLEAAGAVAEVADGPEDAATAGEAKRVTRDLLASLPPRRRAVMLLRYGWGLEPREVCGMVDGLSPRAYRKEITRGVEELARKVRLVDEGRWCEEREPVLRAYASGMADGDEVIQAQRHLEHCRPCSEFVGKLSAQLHDLGAAVVLPGALEGLDGHSTLIEKAGGLVDRARESAAGVFSRGDGGAELVAGASGARGAGTAGAGLAAKLAGLGAAGKAAVACVGGGAAVTVCVAAGVLPLPVDAQEDPAKASAVQRGASEQEVPAHVPSPPWVSPEVVTNPEPEPVRSEDEGSEPAHQEAAPEPSDPVAPSTPPTEVEFGVASSATPVTSSPSSSSDSSDSGSGGGAVAQEFGP